jgi:hypothetical protein
VIAKLPFQFARISCNITPALRDMKTRFCDVTKWLCNISLGNSCIANRQFLPGARRSSGIRTGPNPGFCALGIRLWSFYLWNSGSWLGMFARNAAASNERMMICDNSPAFQGWVEYHPNVKVPQGTAEKQGGRMQGLFVPDGTLWWPCASTPSVQTLGYCQNSTGLCTRR